MILKWYFTQKILYIVNLEATLSWCIAVRYVILTEPQPRFLCMGTIQAVRSPCLPVHSVDTAYQVFVLDGGQNDLH